MLSFYLMALDTEEDKNRFQEIYLTYRQDMYAIAYRILNNCEDAEDAVHEAFVSIADNFAKINQIPCQEIRYYLVIIIRNTAINLYNKNKRRAKHSETLEENEISIEIDYFEKFEYESLVKAISELPAIYKDVIYLHYYEERTAKEIAKLLKITPAAVWKRVERAKRMLKELLEKGGQHEK